MSSTVSPGLISMPLGSGRILITPLSIDISWISKLPAAGEEKPISRSGAVPLLMIFM